MYSTVPLQGSIYRLYSKVTNLLRCHQACCIDAPFHESSPLQVKKTLYQDTIVHASDFQNPEAREVLLNFRLTIRFFHATRTCGNGNRTNFRFPHFKSYYRLAQLAVYEGNLKEASQYLFNRFLTKKKANYNADNIFEVLEPFGLRV